MEGDLGLLGLDLRMKSLIFDHAIYEMNVLRFIIQGSAWKL